MKQLNSKIKAVLSVAILSTVMVGTVVASGNLKTIKVKMNSINIEVNGKAVAGDNIVYKGTTYIPLRAAGEILEREVSWNQDTRTASINNKLPLDNPYANSIITGDELHYNPDINLNPKLTGSYDNPIGVPSNAVLTEAGDREKTHRYDYWINLPSGGCIEKAVMVTKPMHSWESPYLMMLGNDNKKNSIIATIEVDGNNTVSLTYISGKPNVSDDDYRVLRHEADRFIKAYGYKGVE